MKRRGLSGVVATVFLILSGMVSAFIVGYALLGFVVGAGFSPENFSCAEARISPPIEVVSAVYDSSSNEVKVEVRRSFQSSIPVHSLEFTIASSSGGESYSCGEFCGNCVIAKPGMTETYYFYADEKPNQIILGLPGCPLQARNVEDM
jgi:hypothetical protein